MGMVVEPGYVFLLTLGHNLVGMPPITAPGIAMGADIPDESVDKIVDQILEQARQLREKLASMPRGDELGASLRGNPIKLG